MSTEPGIEWRMRGCGEPFPRVVRRLEGDATGWLVDCPEAGETWTRGVRRPEPFEKLLVALAELLGPLIWSLMGTALVGFVAVPRLRRIRVSRQERGNESIDELLSRLRNDRQQRGARAKSADGLPLLEVLRCASCSAPVPASGGATARCGHCGAGVSVPREHQEVARLREAAARDLEKAARIWLVLGLFTAWPVKLTVRLAATLWFPVSMLVVGFGFMLGVLDPLHAVLGFAFMLFGLVTLVVAVGGYGPLRTATAYPPESFAPTEGDHPGESRCRHCGAPLTARAGAFVLVCGYCGTDHLLTRRAQRAHLRATSEAGVAEASLVEATWAVRESAVAAFRLVQRSVLLMAALAALWFLATGLQVLPFAG